jgi:hypothetical protein
MKNKLIFSVLIALVFCLGSHSEAKAQTLLNVLSQPDTVSKASVKVYQDQRIDELVFSRKRQVKDAPKAPVKENTKTEVKEEPAAAGQPEEGTRRVEGFRVQLFSSNVQKTAKMEAFNLEEAFQGAMPDVAVYVTYHSPFWKVRAGNCRTRAEAQELKDKIAEAMPDIKRDLYIVPDKILVK